MPARPASKTVSLLNGTHSVLTPEYVQFNFVLAGLYSRFLAWLIDALITTAIAFALVIALSVMSLIASGIATAGFFISWFLVQWGYAVLFESIWSGQTPGKRALGLRVIQENGVRIGFWNAVLRTLGRPVDSLPVLYLVGGTVALFNKSHQRLGDMLAGTIVVRDRKLQIPSSLIRPEGEQHLLEDALFQSRASKLSEDEQEVIFQAAMRREELGMEARLQLFAALATHLQESRDLYKPPHLSDEKLVLLVAAALVAQKKKLQPKAKARAA